jgi:hypothetical protein
MEFSLLDTFDVVDSQWLKAAKSGGSSDGGDGGFKCYASWIDAHNATVAYGSCNQNTVIIKTTTNMD